MNSNIKIILGFLVFFGMFSSCKKESESTYTVFKGLNIDFKEKMEEGEVYVEFNLSKAASGANMSKVILTEVGGSSTPVYSAILSFGERYTYNSGVILLKSNNPTTVFYNITILDEENNDISSSVTITYPAGKQVVSDAVLISDKEIKTFPEGTTVYLDYNISSTEKDIKSVWLESYISTDVTPPRVRIAMLPDNATDKRNFRGAVRINMNRNGGSKFRIYVTNEAEDYLGDGYKFVNTNVNAGYELTANKFIYFPEFEATKENPDNLSECFYSISQKKAFNYPDAKEQSANIDFGIYMTRPIATNPNVFAINLYSINDVVAGNPMMDGRYNFSEWTKRTTLFTNGLPSNAAVIFNNTLVSASSIRTQASTFSVIMTRRRVTNIQLGTIMYFKTPEGKFGAIYFNGAGKDYKGRMYLNIDVKIEK